MRKNWEEHTRMPKKLSKTDYERSNIQD